jgi:hypothetical protein
LALHTPDIYNLVTQGYQHAYQHFANMPNISFDYAVMEHAKKVAVVPLRTAWNDIGSWDSLQQLLTGSAAQTDENDNRWIQLNGGQCVAQEATNCLVWSHTNRAIGLLGLEGVTVVDTPDALLISKSGSSQSVKQVVEALSAVSHTSLHAPSSESASWGHWEQLTQPEVGEPTVFKVSLAGGETLVGASVLATIASITLLSGGLSITSSTQQAVLHQPLSTYQLPTTASTTVLASLTSQTNFLITTEQPLFPLQFMPKTVDAVVAPLVAGVLG